MKILVTGGAGYIGSHMVKMLIESGHEITVLDNLSNGHRDAVHPAADFLQLDLADFPVVSDLLSEGFDSVMHFASLIQVGESVDNPDIYYKNNLCNTLNLLDAMVRSGCNNLIFSSTAALFGNPEYTPIDENHPQVPINPYGRSKWMVEQILYDYDHAYSLKSISLRYFNAAGAAPDGSLGERHDPETHLIPLVLKTASGQRSHINIFGDDYETDDGTCIRDYIHIMDLCDAHLLALDHLTEKKRSGSYNLGNGDGFSVREVIAVSEEVTGKAIPTQVAPRRTGDPARLVANSSKAMEELGWRPHYTGLKQIISDAWSWHKNNL